jgi:Uma2 family endonuclease
MAITAPGVQLAFPLSADDLAALPDDRRYDLIAGELIEMSPASAKHGRYAQDLGFFIDSHVREHSLGTVFAAETGFLLARDPDTVLAPDVAFVRADRLPPEETWKGFLSLAPELVVEVISPSDTVSQVLEKVLTYLDAGVQMVITVDPQRTAITVYGQDRAARILTISDTLETGDVLPGFRLPLADLFTSGARRQGSPVPGGASDRDGPETGGGGQG